MFQPTAKSSFRLSLHNVLLVCELCNLNLRSFMIVTFLSHNHLQKVKILNYSIC